MADTSKKYAKEQLGRFDPSYPQLATVMDNRDPTKSGKLKVWIQGSQSDKNSKDSWIEASYMAPFAGKTPGIPSADSYGQYPKGYGFWAVPPDVGCTVVVIFAQARTFQAYWIGCVYDQRMNTMVPGMATADTNYNGTDMPLPVTDYDRNTITTDMQDKYINVPAVEGLKKQNLLYDDEAGVANRSSTRQTTSTVYGMSTPRGNSFILDDGYTEEELTKPTWDQDPDGYQDTQFNNPVNDTRVGSRKNEGIVIKTRSGAQLLISEATGNVLLINRDGTARIKFTGDGDIEMHCDKNINIRAGQDINMVAGRSYNIESGQDFNTRVGGNTKLELVGNLDAKVNGQVVINSGADLRLVTGASLRLQSGSSTDITAGSTASIKGSSSANVIGGSSVNISGGGQNLTVDSSGNSGSAAFMAPDFKTPSVGLNDHIHMIANWKDAENHGDRVDPGISGGGQGSTTSPVEPQPANDVKPTLAEQQETEAVQFVNYAPETSEVQTQDLMAAEPGMTGYSQTFEGLHMLMPCSGTIRQNGYWGKGVTTENGTKRDSSGWEIQARGSVVAPDGGIVGISGDAIIVEHKSGYKSVFYGLTSDLFNKDVVEKGQVIGTANGILRFEIRVRSSNIYGFSGSVDPGLFYTTVTGQGSAAANKTLIGGQPSTQNNPKDVVRPSADSDELVISTRIRTIGTGYSQRGSRHVPRRRERKPRNAGTAPKVEQNYNVGNVDKTAVGWKVAPGDSQFISELKEHEGTIQYQTALGYFRNGKFWRYIDSRGFPTIGYGHLIVGGEDFSGGITEAEAEAMLVRDSTQAINDAKSIYAAWDLKTPVIAQQVLCQMVFQMGKYKVQKFKGMLGCLAKGDYRGAAAHIRSSAWYRQTTRRAELMARRIEACQ
ncbi:TPA: glycoside hydrolase family protein [Escherichia coli]|nr:glycoside hydrolase family protein [Escherichia coli]